MSGQVSPPIVPPDVAEFVPRRLRLRHVSALLDEKPSVVRYWFECDLLASRRRGAGRHHWITPEDAIAFALEEGIPPERLDWRAVIDLELDADPS